MNRVSSAADQNLRRGFTLVELLIVISILLLIMTMTIYTVNFLREDEKVSGSANQVQSFLSGARDRAIHRKSPIGVRFFLDNTQFLDDSGNQIAGNRRTVSSMVYIDPAQTWEDGVIRLERADADGNNVADSPIINVVAGVGTGWWELKRRGLLFDGLRMRIPAGPTGHWYPVNTSLIDVSAPPPAVQRLVLGIPYSDPGDGPPNRVDAFGQTGGPQDYELELPPRILPSEPKLLAEGIVVDLDGSKIPSGWVPGTGTGGEYSQYMDVVFSPRGNVIGPAASEGVIHFYVCNNNESVTIKEYFADQAGAGLDLTGFRTWLASQGSTSEFAQLVPADAVSIGGDEPFPITEGKLISVFTQTGTISVSDVNRADSNNNGLADDPYLFAETGSGS